MEELAKKIATDIHNWMNGLKSENCEWVVDPREFLPANVTCDFAGKAHFIKGIAKIIEINLRVIELAKKE